MAVKKSLAESRKFANGTVHEIASGKFMIIDRYLDDDGITMLKYQWVSGDKEGEVEDNKEQNVNANLHKFNVSRGRPKWTEEQNDLPFLDKLDLIVEKSDAIYDRINVHHQITTQAIERIDTKFSNLEDNQKIVISNQQKMIMDLTSEVTRLTHVFDRQHEAMMRQQDTLNKLILRAIDGGGGLQLSTPPSNIPPSEIY